MNMNRAKFQQLADMRIGEAKLLLDNGFFAGAYYLAGYAVECAFKACIAKRTNQYDFPPDRKMVESCYTHRVDVLVKSADLQKDLDTDIQSDLNLSANWSIVKDWNEDSRYDPKDETEARTLYNAITDPAHGVLQWIKVHW